MLCLIEVTDVNADLEMLFRAGPFAPDALKPNFVQGKLLCTLITYE